MPMTHPLAEATLKQIHDYPWPDPKWMDVSRIRTESLAWHRQFAILGAIGRLFGTTPLICWGWRT
jgi:hypothetical protein